MTVLTDDDITEIGKGGFACVMGMCHAFQFARAVEAAVLAKVRAERDFLPPTEREAQAAYLNAKWEREARKREVVARREGYDRALDEIGRRGRNAIDIISAIQAFPDAPLPTKRVPRTVTLSNGSVWEGNEYGCGVKAKAQPSRGVAYDVWINLPPADVRLLADLVERPYEEVPDDA